jgi:hypothetical protein
LLVLAYIAASSVVTARKCERSFLLPTSIIAIFGSAFSLNSFSQRSILSKVSFFEMS